MAQKRENLRWWDRAEKRPLLGKRIVVTRSREQASQLLARLVNLGAEALEFPTIKIIGPESYEPVDAAISRLAENDWVIFTSVNGVDYFLRRLKVTGRDARSFGKARICAIGPATAARLERASLRADFIPARFVAESILEGLASATAGNSLEGQRILLARADVAREALFEGLISQGARVEQITTYRQVIENQAESPGEIQPAALVELLDTGQVDLVTFTSSNTVRNFARRLEKASSKPLAELLINTRVACIGPITSQAARDLGLAVHLEAAEYTIEGLVAEIIKKQG